MKRGKNKREISKELQQEIDTYLGKGGVINEIPKGVSGNLKNHNPFNLANENQNKNERTPLSEIAKEIDARKEKKPEKPIKKERKPKKRLITDDFGQPLRWIWED